MFMFTFKQTSFTIFVDIHIHGNPEANVLFTESQKLTFFKYVPLMLFP